MNFLGIIFHLHLSKRKVNKGQFVLSAIVKAVINASDSDLTEDNRNKWGGSWIGLQPIQKWLYCLRWYYYH